MIIKRNNDLKIKLEVLEELNKKLNEIKYNIRELNRLSAEKIIEDLKK